MIGQDPQPICSEDSVKKFETRMTRNHIFQLISEINKPTDLKEEPDAVNYRQLQRQAIRDMGFGALLDLKIKNIPTALCNFLANNFQTGARQVPLNGNNVLDIKQEDVVAVLDLPRGPKPVEEFKQNDPAITDHAEMVDAFKKRIGYSNKFLLTRSTAAQLIAGRKDFGDDFKRDFLVFVLSYLDRCEYERAHPRSFPVIKSWDQKMLDDRIRLQGSNFTDIQTLERLKKPSSAASRDEQPEAESQEDTQGNPNTQQVYDIAALYEKFYQLIITMSKTVLDIREKEMELKIELDEQAKHIKILTDAMVSMSRKMPPPSDIEIDKAQGMEQLSQTNDEASLAVGKSVPTSKEVVVDEQQTQPQGAQGLDQLSQTNDENSLPVGKSVPTSKEVLNMQRISPQQKRRDPIKIPPAGIQEDSYETTQEKNTQEDVTGSVDLDKDVNETIEAEEYPVPSALNETKNPKQVEKNPKVVEAVPLSIIPPNWNIASTTSGLLMLDKNECTTPPPAISKKAEVLDEGLTKTVEKILNEKPKRRNPPRVHRLPEQFRSPFMLQKKHKKKFIQLKEEKKKMTQEEALLIDFLSCRDKKK
ncbi:OLC1v1034346C1 [Oldenlandia corymbosa var. corymbosa]|uniref:OLC1v1034346C1 n=1 Tax=Oldenlandia corymbosa var. corymbosa TaxID=529605 RepID=A0AAV1CR33_OLDCO|nr:OLC1v1034346C1 [Oldenlandia corymbosa var. corymbosa]